MFGSLAAGIVKHLDGRRIGRFFAEEFAQPLAIDAWMGLRAEHASRLALLHGDSGFTMGPDNTYPFKDLGVVQAEIPGAGGVASARAMARLYGLLVFGGMVDGRRYFSEETAVQAGVVLDEGVDEVIQKYWQRGLGFVISLGPPGNPQFSTIGQAGDEAATSVPQNELTSYSKAGSVSLLLRDAHRDGPEFSR